MAHRQNERELKTDAERKTFKKKLILIITAIAAVVGVAGYFAEEKYHIIEDIALTFESDVHIVKGIDISHHNPVPDWEKLEKEGVNFVYMKATEGTTHEDRNYPYNYDAARKSNIKIGAYHFYTFAASGKDQAKHFIRVANSQPGDLIPVIDVEHSPANPYSKDQRYIDKVVKELRALESELRKYYGIPPVIYTNRDCYKLYINNGHFTDNLMWIVDLNKEPPAEIENWRIWQYSHTGSVPGMKGDTDLNYYRYTSKEFAELLLPHSSLKIK